MGRNERRFACVQRQQIRITLSSCRHVLGENASRWRTKSASLLVRSSSGAAPGMRPVKTERSFILFSFPPCTLWRRYVNSEEIAGWLPARFHVALPIFSAAFMPNSRPYKLPQRAGLGFDPHDTWFLRPYLDLYNGNYIRLEFLVNILTEKWHEAFKVDRYLII